MKRTHSNTPKDHRFSGNSDTGASGNMLSKNLKNPGDDSFRDSFVLDIRGQICPACLLISLKELHARKQTIKSGEGSLVVLTDHRDATRTIPNAVIAMGYSVDVRKKDGYYEITIKKERQT